MTKLFLGLAIIAFTTFCGYLLTKKHRKRHTFFTQFTEFNERFLSEIAYFKRPVGEFLAKKSYRGEFAEFLELYYKNIANPQAIQTALFTDDYAFLNKEEKTVIFDYFFSLGKGNAISQSAYFNGMKVTLKTLKENAEKDNKRYGDLFIKLGFLCGLLILILIV
jgi:stage III sporulation protein AB